MGLFDSVGRDKPGSTASRSPLDRESDLSVRSKMQENRKTSRSSTIVTEKQKDSIVGTIAKLRNCHPNHLSSRHQISQIIGENPSFGSFARVIRTKYHIRLGASASSWAPFASRWMEESKWKTTEAVPCLYEVEFPTHRALRALLPPPATTASLRLGIELETDLQGRYAIVKRIQSSGMASSIKQVILPGFLVVAVNGTDVSPWSFSSILERIREQSCQVSAPLLLRFLDPSVLLLNRYRHEEPICNCDEYGFAKSDKHIIEATLQQPRRKHRRLEAAEKWANFMSKYGGPDIVKKLLEGNCRDDCISEPFQEELRMLVVAGIPGPFRPQIWASLARISLHKQNYPMDYYAGLLDRVDSSPSLPDIEKDVCRTFPDHPFFGMKQGRRELRNMLAAYSLHNPSIGYCQSMNFITGMMLLFMPEEDAFWLLTALLHEKPSFYLCAGNYSQTMLGSRTDQLVFQQLVQKCLPDIASHFKANGIQIQLITLHWFLCGFLRTLPTETALRVWDVFLLDGQKILFQVALAILDWYRPCILKAEHDDLQAMMRDLGDDLHDEDTFISFCTELFLVESVQTEGNSTSKKSSSTDGNLMQEIQELRMKAHKQLEREDEALARM
uniref:Uncharacterized protein AlNc14C26G2575 n=1 Tax=Albugo laibachii Nc14 TaxID=890382 RepID=F0W6T9_9STRA|nr:hypothetical protein SELMODRAFT_131270 [Albugo laibachii Nc14]|eukprot:CCA16834.1 hypothetical protein SELMODRAFT_131270 [Albugo laibachii Nc14]